ncbi:MAG: DUF2203 domain-containing protein [Candidatus Dormibacteria bacterium]
MERVFTEDEANALLPQLVELLPRLRDAHEKYRGGAQGARQHAASNGSAPESMMEGNGEYAQLLAQITELGVVLRDPATGLCDFPATRGGEPVYLCWRLGEDRVGYWHPRDTGAAGRQPL